MNTVIALIPRFIEAMGVTLEVSVLAALIGLVAGFALNATRLALGRPFALVYGAFVWLVRGTPYLSQLVIVYFGLPVIGITLSAVQATILSSLAFYSSDYVDIKAAMDCVVVMSACPQDIIPINALNPLEVEFTVLA